MPFISTSDHQKFIRQFHLFLAKHPKSDNSTISDEDLRSIKAEIDKLEQIASAYKDSYFHLQDLAKQYKVALKQTKINIRRQQIKKMETTRQKVRIP